MKKLSAFVILFSVMALTVSAQKKLYLSQNPKWVEWADSPRVHDVPPEYASQPAIRLLNDITIDYRLEGGYIVKHVTRHVVIKVLDARGINEYDELLIPLSNGTRVPTVRARTISPAGKVQYFDFYRAYEGVDGYGRHVFMWPLEGIQKNTEIEYLVKEVQQADYFGEELFQDDIPTVTTRFRLSYRKNMVVEGRSLNGFPKLTPELVNNRMLYKVEMTNIPELYPEKNSFYNLHAMAFEYRVSYYMNENEEKIKLNTYDNLARKLFDDNYKFTQKELRAVNVFLSDIGVRPFGNEVENIKKIEQGIKKNIVLYPHVDYEERKEVIATKERRSMSVYSAGYEDTRDILDTVLSKKAASRKGYLRLFAACLTQAGIDHEMGLAWDRTKYRIGAGFESWRGLNHALIYFPNQKKFLSPTEYYLRYPVVPSVLSGSKGVFCTIPKRGAVTGTLYRIRRITPLSAKDNRVDITASVSFSKNMDAKVDMSREWNGYSSADIRTKLPFVRPENMKKYVAGLLELTSNPADITNFNFSNDDLNYYSENKPIALYASVNTPDLVSKGGAKYLVKVGSLIGNQENLYDNKPRTMPVDIEYPTSSRHTITINIPKGYKVLNPEATRMSADYLNGELEQVISFNSNYRLVKDAKNGDRLIVTVTENYSQLHFPLIEYDRFRKVWNTAADFNNVTLVMARK